MTLVAITQEEFDLELDLAYATAGNITGEAIYAQPRCFLHRDAAGHLLSAAALAKPLGYRLKIFDAFRPVEAQQLLWDRFPDPEFVADPRSGSDHSRGIAVDLTLVHADSGIELDMGTPFDDFTARAHHRAQDISAESQRNRLILLGLMAAAGWNWYDSEWWHYQLFEGAHYALLKDCDAPQSMMRLDAA